MTYFDRHRDDWDGIYHAPIGSLRARINRRFRRAVWGRMAIALSEFPTPLETTVLDVGCGTGELGIRLAARGARRVVGIDLAAAMVETARRRAEAAGVGGRCAFLHGDLLDTDLGGETFDLVAALGVLDYVADAPRFLERMWSSCRRRMVVSLPHAVPPRSWARTIWHGLHGSRLSYYRSADIARIAARLHPATIRVHAIHGSDRTDVLVCERVATAVTPDSTPPLRRWRGAELTALLESVRS